MRTAIVLLATLFLISCVPYFDTPEVDPPEVFIPSVSRDQVIQKVVSTAEASGGSVVKVDEFKAVILPFGGATQDILFGSILDPNIEKRIYYNFFEIDSGVRVTAQLKVISSVGSDLEKSRDITYAHPRSLQNMLNSLKGSFEGEAR